MSRDKNYTPYSSLFFDVSRWVARNFKSFIHMPKDDLKFWRNQPVILIVPGFMVWAYTMSKLWNVLSESFNIAYLEVIPFGNINIKTSAKKLVKKIKALQKDWYSVVPLWWCMGGLTALEGVARYGLAINAIMTVSIPFGWSGKIRSIDLLKWLLFPWLYQINHQDKLMYVTEITRSRVNNIVCVITDDDTIVDPSEQIPPNVLNAHTVRIPWNHLDILFRKKRIEEIAALLREMISIRSANTLTTL